MGQSHPNDNRRQVKGGIYIQLQKTAFVSNQVIQGLLNINLEEPYQGNILQVTLQGVEETRYTYSVRAGKHSKTVYAKGRNEFLNFSIPVYDFAQGSNESTFVIQPCQVVIPFQITVSDKLPSSVKYFIDQNNQCNLKYQLIAQIIPKEPNVKPVSGNQEIYIGQQLPVIEQPNTTSSSLSPLVCCCCNPGQISYKVTTNGRYFSPNEIINIQLEVDFSKHKYKIQNLNVKLIGQVDMKSFEFQRNKIINVFEKCISLKVDKLQIKQEVQLQVPANISMTSQGQLIQVNYYLQIQPEVKTIFHLIDIPHTIQMFINPNPSQNLNCQEIPQLLKIQAPPNWNPIQIQQYQFSQQQLNEIKLKQQQFLNQEQQYLNQQQQQHSQQQIQMGIIPNPLNSDARTYPYGQPQMINQNQNYI
ncbi:arrestin (macronuclear) [Tetrahymena thermophila SB210]|uniref:Arrestin n=1 Tax=Tetrahymena thermophila (strain SB210) TaxID=312017 RepID=Q229Z0_TETTS|nr:arrestin [Tetrahymena thermophila SB210]EAR82097.4 arrestin [Tetrahymena thermophila SB210]|eukprot:XP_001029760.4 arrestin [Tetrahymena thermophila SB210]